MSFIAQPLKTEILIQINLILISDESTDFKNAFDSIDKELETSDSKEETETTKEDKKPTSGSGEEKKASVDESTVENNLGFNLPKPVKSTTNNTNNSDEKEAIAKADNEPTTTTTDTVVKPDTEVTPGDSGKKPDSPPKSPDQSESKSEIKPEKMIEDAIALKQ
jgi:hypothetical protein